MHAGVVESHVPSEHVIVSHVYPAIACVHDVEDVTDCPSTQLDVTPDGVLGVIDAEYAHGSGVHERTVEDHDPAEHVVLSHVCPDCA